MLTKVPKKKQGAAADIIEEHIDAIDYYEEQKDREISKLLRGEFLKQGIQQGIASGRDSAPTTSTTAARSTSRFAWASSAPATKATS